MSKLIKIRIALINQFASFEDCIYLQYLLCLQFCESFIIFFEIKFHCANKKRNTLDFLFLNFHEKIIYFCNLLVEDLSITVVVSNLFNIKHKNTCAVREKQSVQSNRYSEQTWKISCTPTWLIRSLSKRTQNGWSNGNESLAKHLLFAKQPDCTVPNVLTPFQLCNCACCRVLNNTIVCISR